jgi:hypothetical protein
MHGRFPHDPVPDVVRIKPSHRHACYVRKRSRQSKSGPKRESPVILHLFSRRLRVMGIPINWKEPHSHPHSARNVRSMSRRAVVDAHRARP